MRENDSYGDIPYKIFDDNVLTDKSLLEFEEPTSENSEKTTTNEAFLLDVPLYRLKLAYTHETFLAFFEGKELQAGSKVITSTRYGNDIAEVMSRVKSPGPLLLADVFKIERKANSIDIGYAKANEKNNEDAFHICREKIGLHKLAMKLIAAHYLLEKSKIVFFFSAENRVDFRDLVKDLVTVFKVRVELRQIGARDEARIVGGLGICGRSYCCHSVSDKLKPVSIKMAKDQNLSLNSIKISAPCGRLLCCLSYEHAFYQKARRSLPSEGTRINYDGSSWKVIEVNPVAEQIKLVSDDSRYLSLPCNRLNSIDGRWQIKGEEVKTPEPIPHRF